MDLKAKTQALLRGCASTVVMNKKMKAPMKDADAEDQKSTRCGISSNVSPGLLSIKRTDRMEAPHLADKKLHLGLL